MADKILKSLNFGTEDDYYFAQSADKINGVISVENGGFGATTAKEARQNIGAASEADLDKVYDNFRCMELSEADDGNGNLTIGLVNLLNSCIPLEYLQSTGKQHIDLEIKPSDDMEFEIEYQSLATRATKLFGCENTSKSLFDAYDVGKTQAMIRVFAHGGVNGGSPTTITTIAGQKTSLKLIVKNGTYSVYVNGELVATSPAGGVVPNLNIFLFASNRNGKADGGGSQIIYGCRVKKSGELVGKFKPFLINGKPGFLNIIDKSFHFNLGTGEFEVGLDNYVKDSLMVWLDGIKNTRNGHNVNASVWEDLAGPYNFAKTSAFSFGDNHILTTGQIDSKYGAIVPSEYTLEIVYQYNGNTNYGIGMEQFSPMFRGRKDTVSWWARKTPDSGDSTRLYYHKFEINAPLSIAITQNANGGKCYYNGVLKKSNSDVFSNSGYQKIRNYIGSEVMTGKIFAIRLHKRALTDTELDRNYEIDKVRFGLDETINTVSTLSLDEPDYSIDEGTELSE